MVSTVPDRAPLGAATTNRKWFLDVQDPENPGPWVGVFGITTSTPRPSEPTTQDDSDMDGGGFTSQAVTALTAGFDGKLNRKLLASDPTAYDPGQEILRKAAGRLGAAAVVPFRYYEMEPNGPRVEAHQGKANVSWKPDGGDMTSLDSVTFSLTCRGALIDIPHPEGETAAPVITSALPAEAAEGDSVVIQGAYFTGTTGVAGVKFGGVNASDYEVLNDGAILAVVPTGAAGSAPIKVGTSAEFPYTRGA